jgi:hypothetical protein
MCTYELKLPFTAVIVGYFFNSGFPGFTPACEVIALQKDLQIHGAKATSQQEVHAGRGPETNGKSQVSL